MILFRLVVGGCVQIFLFFKLQLNIQTRKLQLVSVRSFVADKSQLMFKAVIKGCNP